jgi:hypothetical protein
MTQTEIVELVLEVTMVDVRHIRKNVEHDVYARYIAIMMMNEEGYRNSTIATFLKIRRETPYTTLKRTDNLIQDNKQFKKMYLSCIRAMADKEDNQ